MKLTKLLHFEMHHSFFTVERAPGLKPLPLYGVRWGSIPNWNPPAPTGMNLFSCLGPIAALGSRSLLSYDDAFDSYPRISLEELMYFDPL